MSEPRYGRPSHSRKPEAGGAAVSATPPGMRMGGAPDRTEDQRVADRFREVEEPGAGESPFPEAPDGGGGRLAAGGRQDGQVAAVRRVPPDADGGPAARPGGGAVGLRGPLRAFLGVEGAEGERRFRRAGLRRDEHPRGLDREFAGAELEGRRRAQARRRDAVGEAHPDVAVRGVLGRRRRREQAERRRGEQSPAEGAGTGGAGTEGGRSHNRGPAVRASRNRRGRRAARCTRRPT